MDVPARTSAMVGKWSVLEVETHIDTAKKEKERTKGYRIGPNMCQQLLRNGVKG